MAEEAKEYVLRCAQCSQVLTKPLRRYTGPLECGDQKPYVPPRTVGTTDGESFGFPEGRFAVGLADVNGLEPVADLRRRNGCCGLDGCDGPNTMCACGAELATEKSDCWMPHAVVFEPDMVVLTPASS